MPPRPSGSISQRCDAECTQTPSDCGVAAAAAAAAVLVVVVAVAVMDVVGRWYASVAVIVIVTATT